MKVRVKPLIAFCESLYKQEAKSERALILSLPLPFYLPTRNSKGGSAQMWGRGSPKQSDSAVLWA